MKASVVDLRYRMKDVLKALDRNEDVSILYRGKTKGVITAEVNRTQKPVAEHPFFGMRSGDERNVEAVMEQLRGDRYGDL